MSSDGYDLIVIGTGPRGASLAHRLAPTGKRILILERGDYLPRSEKSWDPQTVFVDAAYQARETWTNSAGDTDPATSVLDLDCKAHELDNLYPADASFFPSIGAVNPTLTIVANALRVADRMAALLLAAYCAATAALYKRFWQPGDFWAPGESQGCSLFWDFLKNLSLGAGFLLIVIGTNGSGVRPFLAHPLASSHPYASSPESP